MSTEGAVTRLLLIGTILLLTPATSRAAQVQFLPEAELRVFRDGNVRIVGDETVSDDVTSIGIDLAFAVKTPSTSGQFSYAPSREVHNDSSDLDNTSHRASASLSHEISRRASFRLGLSASRTQRQQFRIEEPETALSLVPRSTQERASLVLGGRIGAGRLSFVEWSTEAGAVRYEDTGDTEPGTFDDSDTVSAGLGWGRRISQTTELGVRAGAQVIDYESRPDTDTQSVAFFLTRQIGRNLAAALEAGMIRSDTAGETATDPSVDFSVSRAKAEGSSFTIGIRQRVSSGTGLSAATLDRGAYVAWSPGRMRTVQASLGATYWQRESVDGTAVDTRGEVKTFETSASVAWAPGRGNWALGAFHSYRDQNEAGGASPFLETSLKASYHSGGVFLRWAHRGRERS